MKGYVAQRRGRFCAVVYQGRDPATGKGHRTWRPDGIERQGGEARRLAAEEATPMTILRAARSAAARPGRAHA